MGNMWVRIRSQNNRILKAHHRHFLTLSIIFVLPLCSFMLTYPILFFQLANHLFGHTTSMSISIQDLVPSHIVKHLVSTHSQRQPIKPTLLFFYLLYSFFFMFFSFSAITTVTYSVLHAFYGQHFNLLSSVKPIFTSFFPLLATTILLKAIFFLISLLFALLFFLIVVTLSHSSSPYLVWFSHPSSVLVVLAFFFVLMYLQVKWTLVRVIVIAESRWGLEALRRSTSLMKGMKREVVFVLLFIVIVEEMFVWYTPASRVLLMGSNGILVGFDWTDIMRLIAGNSILLALLLLSQMTVNTVLYIYCKATHGEDSGKGFDTFAY